MITKQDKIEAIKELEHVLRHSGETRNGICVLLKPFISKDELGKIMKTWPRHSGNDLFPVPSIVEGETEEDWYYISLSKNRLWAPNEYGDLRRDLAHHIINELTKEITITK